MAETITVSYTGGLTRSATYANGIGTRHVAAAKVRLNLPAATNAEVFNALVDEFFNNLDANTENTEREIARAAAAATIAPITRT